MTDNQISLNKSHSKWSNFCLTLICFLITIITAAIWIVLAFKDYIIGYRFYGILALLVIMLICLLFIIIKFRR